VSSGLRAWIDFHNLDSEIWQRTAESASSPAVRWFARLQAPRVGRLEQDLARRAAGTSCVSVRDAAALPAFGAPAEPLVVPNGVDLSRYRFRQDGPREEMVFFVGDLSWPPNAEAIRWFGGRVWPLVKEARPAARAEILGRGAPPDLAAISGPDFQLLGEGADTRPYWERAAVAAVPLLAGGGTRLKILEAAACGVPVVSTSVGAEGLDLEPGREVRLADSPEAFAREVAALLCDPAAGRAQAAAARARVEALYDWDRIGRRLAEELLRRGALPA
jgi:glycosyltransferase involved in cell wall biosynthesis